MKRKNHKIKSNKKPESNQEDYLSELYGLDMIMGYTSGGVPYGPTKDNNDVMKLMMKKMMIYHFNKFDWR